jgi:tRNA (guanine37-N1)-methyltransferase
MEIGVISIFPEMFEAVTRYGITRVAIESGDISLTLYNPRDYTSDRHRSVDDRPYGGGPGMVMKPEPLAGCIDAAKKAIQGPVIYLSPQGRVLDQELAKELSAYGGMILLAGRYEGIDERIVSTRVDMEISIGDYVLAGGELPAMVLVDSIARLLPGVLGNEKSALEDSFSDGLLDCPHFTRPEIFEGHEVPPVLMSGDHEKIRQWRQAQSRARTKLRRPDLFEKQDRPEKA